jgi:hypothetical protein
MRARLSPEPLEAQNQVETFNQSNLIKGVAKVGTLVDEYLKYIMKQF